MCYNCGCHNPDDDMGDASNITNKTFSELAKEWNKSVQEVKAVVYHSLTKNIFTPEEEMMFAKAAKAWGQSIDEAKKQTYSLLKSELKQK